MKVRLARTDLLLLSLLSQGYKLQNSRQLPESAGVCRQGACGYWLLTEKGREVLAIYEHLLVADPESVAGNIFEIEYDGYDVDNIPVARAHDFYAAAVEGEIDA